MKKIAVILGMFILLVTTAQATYVELKWDDGYVYRAFSWLNAGWYWAVQFNEDKTGGESGFINQIGLVIPSGEPDNTYEGGWVMIFDDNSGVPGTQILRQAFDTDETRLNQFQWVDIPETYVSTSTFYIVFEQAWDGGNTDGICVDAHYQYPTHNWTYEGGTWRNNDQGYGDYMIRCHWRASFESIEEATWGQVKATDF
jgi:hypothetical protein